MGISAVRSWKLQPVWLLLNKEKIGGVQNQKSYFSISFHGEILVLHSKLEQALINEKKKNDIYLLLQNISSI